MENNQELQVISDNKLIEYLDVMGIGTNLTDNEKKLFLEIAKGSNLNPFKREIHVSKYGKNGTLSIITGYEVYIKRAERSGQLDGWGCTTEGNVEAGTLKAILTIHRKDRKHPFVHEVYYSEYVQQVEIETTDQKTGHSIKTGKFRPTKFWQKAHTMIKKVAMAQGFRLCFSDELGGMPYTADEMPETIDTTHTEVKESTSAPVAAVPLAPTPQPVIDNHVHAVNAIKKHNESLATVKEQWDRMDLPTKSHPAVIDEMAANMVAFIKASANMSTLKSVWATMNNIDKSFILMPSLIEVKEARKIELTPAKTA